MSGGRVMGVDLGDVRVGIAVSDPDGRVATPSETMQVPQDALGDEASLVTMLADRARASAAVRIVVGLPRDPSGRDGVAASRARRLAARLATEVGLPVDLWDERFTTVEAERALKEQGLDGRQRRRVIDQVAATLLLQSYLDHRTRHTAEAR